ncbi:MAG: hypothetical protein K2P81_03095 [Bacteriovoracaceae bacterium]|nr:hypothetical protein [Bacteriovoracaceae bacterium]
MEECLSKEIEIKSFQEVLKLETVKIEADHARKQKIFTSLELDYQKAHKELARLTYEADDLTKKINLLHEQEQKQIFKIEMLKGEHQASSQALQLESQRLKNEHDEHVRRLKDDFHSHQAKLDEIKSNIRMAQDDLNLIHSKREKSQVLVESLEVSKRHFESEIKELEHKRDNVGHEIEQLNSQLMHLQRQHQVKTHELKDLDLRLHQTQSYISQIQLENEKDLEVKRHSFDQSLLIEREALINEIDLMKIKALKDLESEKLKREEEIRDQADKLLVSAHRRLNEASYEAQEREAKAHSHLIEAQKVYQDREKAAQDLYVQAEQKIQTEFHERKQRMKSYLANKQDRSLKALVQLNALHLKKLSKLEFQSRIKIEQIKRSELKKIAQVRDLELGKQNELKDRLKLEIKEERKKIIHQLNTMKIEQERELENTKKLALQNIQNTKTKTVEDTQLEIKREKETFEKSKAQRLQNATHSVLKLLSSHELPAGFEQQLKQSLSQSLDGKFSISTEKGEKILEFNPLNQKKIIPVLQKYGIRFGIPAAILLTFGLDIGSIRTSSKDLIVQALKQKESASEKYVTQQKQEWREKNTYNPPTTLGYKSSFVDNVLYTTDFLKVVSDESFQNDWILKLHGFITTDLELSEDIAISYISSEGALIKELEMARGDIHPNYLEAGLAKLHEIEKKHLSWLETKVSDKAKLDKFFGFRKDFYEGFYETQFKPNRSMASEPKPQEVLKILGP